MWYDYNIMKKGYYIHFGGRESIGVSKKMDMQMEEFKKYYDMRELEVITPARSLPERVLGLFPTMSIRREYEQALEQLEQPDFLYVRRTVADRAYLYFWRKVKEKYPQCKIIIEIFSYPYDKDDFGKWNAWPFYFKERIYRPRLKRYVDRFVTYTQDREIFGIPTLCTTNGIVVDNVRQIEGQFAQNRLSMIAVAFMQRHHGYERIIEGMYQYYDEGAGTYQVELNLVGDGPEKSMYQELVQKYHLEDYVHFYPTLTGQKLDELYDESDLALVSFGMYKVGYFGKMMALKSRECLAKGMPLLTGCAIDVLEDDYPYAKTFPNDAGAVDMAEVIRFFEQIKESSEGKGELSDKIRQFALDHVSMEAVMRPIIHYIGL